ncbi:hypothetical protein GF402_01585 [Candidatus Fermentibacteria bacterium]|nr:hypothetical protein [Candidatus Fermentibacteria bacterium]
MAHVRYALLSTVLLLFACTSSELVVEEYTPITRTGSGRLGVAPFSCSLVGKVGDHHAGEHAMVQHSWVLGRGLSASFPSQLSNILVSELRGAGYSASIVDEEGAEDYTLSLVVSGAVTEVDIHTYSPACGNKVNCTIKIRFDVTDPRTGDVVKSAVYSGCGVAEGTNDLVSGIRLATHNAVRHMLAESDMARTLSRS